MKAFERIFLYSVLMVLVVYVFLVDGNVESKVAIQDHIMVRRISIMNNEGQEVVLLWTTPDGIGLITIANKAGVMVTGMTSGEDGGRINIFNMLGIRIADMRATNEGDGVMAVYNRYGKGIGSLP